MHYQRKVPCTISAQLVRLNPCLEGQGRNNHTDMGGGEVSLKAVLISANRNPYLAKGYIGTYRQTLPGVGGLEERRGGGGGSSALMGVWVLLVLCVCVFFVGFFLGGTLHRRMLLVWHNYYLCNVCVTYNYILCVTRSSCRHWTQRLTQIVAAVALPRQTLRHHIHLPVTCR